MAGVSWKIARSRRQGQREAFRIGDTEFCLGIALVHPDREGWLVTGEHDVHLSLGDRRRWEGKWSEAAPRRRPRSPWSRSALSENPFRKIERHLRNSPRERMALWRQALMTERPIAVCRRSLTTQRAPVTSRWRAEAGILLSHATSPFPRQERIAASLPAYRHIPGRTPSSASASTSSLRGSLSARSRVRGPCRSSPRPRPLARALPRAGPVATPRPQEAIREGRKRRTGAPLGKDFAL